tara:strand:+ start:642 stop:1172 length:531 start_codon:yes stop_codon:yes gene_type:complete
VAHAFTIITTSNETVVYTDYDTIDLTTLKHVISFKPDLGTLVDGNEILLETATIDATTTSVVMLEDSNSVTDTNGVTYVVPTEDALLLEDGDKVIYEAVETIALGKLIPENWATGLENHLVLETASATNIDNHFHPPVGEHHADGDGHTEAEHRELALWENKLKLLMARERLNNAS